MSSPPTKYLRYADFTTFASLNPEKPLPGASVDVEFNRLKSTTDQTIDRLALIQNDDGTLRGVVGTAQIMDGAITEPKLATGAVSNRTIQPNAVTGGQIQQGSINNTHIIDNGIVTRNLTDLSVTNPKLADKAVTYQKIADFTIGSLQLVDNAVDTRILNANAVTTPKLQDLSVTTPKIADFAVTANKIAPGAITGSQIPDGSLAGIKLVPGSVGTAQLSDGGVTLAKLAPNSVDSSKIVDGSITPSDLNASTIALMTAAGNPRGAWLTNTDYASKDAVTNGSGVYVCITAHHSGVFATDLAAGKWYQTGTIYDQSLNTTDSVRFTGLNVTSNQNAATIGKVTNTDPGAAAKAQWSVATAGAVLDMGMLGANNPGFGPLFASEAYLLSSANFCIGVSTLGSLFFATNNLNRMTLDPTGNLGIGIAPTDSLTVFKDQNTNTIIRVKNPNAGNVVSAGVFADTGTGVGGFYMYGTGYTTGTADKPNSMRVVCSGVNGMTFENTNPAGTFEWWANFARRLILTAGGNLCLGGAPLAWMASSSNLTFAGGGAVGGFTTNGAIVMYNNLYVDVSSSYHRVNADGGALVAMNSGQLDIYTVPNGAANSAATVNDMFRVWNSGSLSSGFGGGNMSDIGMPGRLTLGPGSAGGAGGAIYIFGSDNNGSNAAILSPPAISGVILGSYAGGPLQVMTFKVVDATVGTIVTTASNTAYNTTSDETLKNFAVPQRDFRKLIQSIAVRDGEFIAEPGKYRLMISARQLHAVGYGDAVTPPIARTPEQIEEDNRHGFKQNTRWMADYGRLSPLALWGVQDLYQIIAGLEARLTAKGI